MKRILALALVSGAGVVLSASLDFVSTWKAPDATALNFTGRKVAAVLVTDDDSLRVSTEEALAREITARGTVGVAAYKIIPKPEVKKPEAAKEWFAKANIEGLVILRIVKTETQKVYSSSVWVSGYYGYAYDYWGYSWGSVYPIGKARTEPILTVETLLYDLSKGTPIWAGVSRATNPKSVQTYIKELTFEVVQRLEKDGLLKTTLK
jgi:hypothetical protein